MGSRTATQKSGQAQNCQPMLGGARQRKCACDSALSPSGGCEECRQKRFQRKTLNSELRTLAVSPIVDEVARSHGQPPQAAMWPFTEQSFGHDFSRIHAYTDTQARGGDVIQAPISAGRARAANGRETVGWRERMMNGFHSYPAAHRAIPFRAENPKKTPGSEVYGVRHQGQNLGVTYCDYDSGTLMTPPVDEHCAGDCVAQHEKAHRDDANDGECCKRMKACLDKAGNKPGRQQACEDAHKAWYGKSESHSECVGYTKEEACLVQLIANKCRGKGRSRIWKVIGGILGGIGGLLGGLFLGGLGGALGGALFGGFLGWKSFGLLSQDCCDKLREDLDAVTEEKEKYCGAAQKTKPVPCPFAADGTITANPNRTDRDLLAEGPATATAKEDEAMSPKQAKAEIAPIPTSVRGGVLQRACACGQHASGGECEECRKKREDTLQRAPVDSAPASEAPPIVHEVLRSPGQPLDAATRAFMKPRFGHDFSQVQVHTDARAAESARAINAQAYTLGRNVVFGKGQYAPQTSEGRKLLAHELTHVIQQRNHGASSPPPVVGAADTHEETEARSAEASVNEPGIYAGSRPVNGSRVLRRREQGPTQSAAQSGNAASTAPDESGSCLQPVTGEEIESLLESRVVTVIEYGAEWCGPCRDLQADLTDICQRFRTAPPPVKVRFYTVDVDDPRNEEAHRREAPGSIPYLSIYVGTSRRHHESGRPEFEILEQLINEQIKYASSSGAARGALTGLKWGLGIGGGVGLALGIGLAFAGVLTGGLGLLGVFGLAAGGAALGAGLGAATGAIIGALTDKRERAAGARVGFNEAETLIRRRFGRHLPAPGGPLANARIRPVTQAQLQMWHRCRHPEGARRDLSDLVGWTDSGSPPPATIAYPDDEPECANGQRLEHATLERPVIYYARDRRDLTVLIHEGLHAYAHPNFTAQARNYVNEGAAEYFTRRLASEIGASAESGYGENTERVKNLVAVVGEEALQLAYFRGDFRAANRVLGPCGMERWAQLLQMFSDSAAEEVLSSRNRNYCEQVEVFPSGVSEEEHSR